MNKVLKYFNPGQIELLEVGANSETIVASRRFGKSDGIIAPRLLRNVQHMPQSAGAILQATFQQALARTVPASMASLARMGFKEGVHYFVGRKAPKTAGFKKPLINPATYDHVIHWYNGSIQHILSQDVKFSSNSLTLDYLMIDEGRSINVEKLKDETIPAISGYPGAFDHIPWHKGITIVSDMPHNRAGEWLLERVKLMNTGLIELIKDIKREIYHYQQFGSASSRATVKRLEKELNEFRREAHYYREFDSIDNLEILGEKYIRQMKRELTPLVFRLSIANKFLRKLANGFYPNLDSRIHYYKASNPSHVDNLRGRNDAFDFKKIQDTNCLFDSDIADGRPLSIALDYNANINWIVTGQPIGTELRTLSSFYVKNEKKLRALVEKWAEYYRFHSTRTAIYYYDSTAIGNSYADEHQENFSEIVIHELQRHGWTVAPVYIGQPMAHNLKHQYIDDAFTGKKYLFPTFNSDNNEFLLPAMEQTGVRIGRNGFEKDKSGEKLEETETDPLELRTDGTDAWDTLFIGCNFHPHASNPYAMHSIGQLGR